MTPEKVRFFLPRSRRHRPISLRNIDMLSTLALAVLTWGKKAPEPEPEPASTLGMTLLAVGVCWVPLSVNTCGLCTARTCSPARLDAADQQGLAEARGVHWRWGASAAPARRTRSCLGARAGRFRCGLDPQRCMLPHSAVGPSTAMGAPPSRPTTPTGRARRATPSDRRPSLTCCHLTLTGAAASAAQVR